MPLTRETLSDRLSAADWQRLRNFQLANPFVPVAPDEPEFEQTVLADDMPMEEWQDLRSRQAREGYLRPPGGEVGDDAAPRQNQTFVQLAQLTPRSAPRFTPMSALQWEVETARALSPEHKPSSDNPVEMWAASRVGKPGYNRVANAPDARGPLDNKFPLWLRGRGDPKCNQFVWDALTAAGVQPPRVDGGRILVAREWGDPKSDIPGYTLVTGAPQPGDVVSDGDHVAIYSPLANGKPGTISAATRSRSSVLGGVVHNDWGFRSSQVGKMTIWRPSSTTQR